MPERSRRACLIANPRGGRGALDLPPLLAGKLSTGLYWLPRSSARDF
jgi:hypothetical protein